LPVEVESPLKHPVMAQPPSIRHHYISGSLAYCTLMNLHHPGMPRS
jgi:hypothetical protein